MQVNPTQFIANTENADKLEKWHTEKGTDGSAEPRW